jgi:CheY-like chemotaxis protein
MPNGGDLSVYVENCVLDTRETVMNVQSRGGRYVTKSVQAGTGRYVTLTVTDSGMGIPIEIIDKIFEPFFTTKSVDQGTGLGLSTVLAIAKSHGGAVNAYSENGKGATFKVYLPVLEEVAVSNRLEEDISLPRGNGETVLVVDDEASIRVITSQTLLAFGYRVLTATDGADALSIYVQNKNDIAVVIIDIIMPVLDGLATINALTRINPSVKIVGASGVSQDAAGSKSAGHPIKHFLIKPYTATSLLTVLKTVLAQS